jgi:hypothetical protein
MKRSNPYSLGVGAVIILVGVIWLIDNAVGFDIAWKWVLPVLLILFGIYIAVARDEGPPPSQFERDDAPRVP